MANWIKIQSELDIEKIKEVSFKGSVLIFKHSTSCPISSTAKDRLDRNRNDFAAIEDIYYLDLIAYRSISNAIASEFGVRHESPQVLIIKDGVCIYNESHFGIRAKAIAEQV